MEKIRILLLFLLFLCFSTSAFAEENNDDNKGISIGISGLFGTNTLDTSNVVEEYEPGFIAGGGITLQKILAKYMSAGTGLEYRYFEFEFNYFDNDTSAEIDAVWEFQAISVPFHLIATIKGPSSSLDLHAGMTYTYIFSSEMVTKDDLSSGIKTDDVMRFTSPSQIAVSGGVILRFAVTTYSDFFMGIMTEYYFTDLLNLSHDNEKIHLLNYSFNTGYMLRTDLF